MPTLKMTGCVIEGHLVVIPSKSSIYVEAPLLRFVINLFLDHMLVFATATELSYH